VHDEPGWLVHHDDLLVLVEDLERDVGVGLGCARKTCAGLDLHDGSTPDSSARSRGLAVHGHPPLLDPAFERAAGGVGQEPQQGAVQPLGLDLRDDEAEPLYQILLLT
jgi:hypothetical protein